MNEDLYNRADEFFDDELSPLENMVRFAKSYHNTEIAKINTERIKINHNSIEIRQLLRKVQSGDEKALDELHTLIDDLANTNIMLYLKFKRIKTIVNNIE